MPDIAMLYSPPNRTRALTAAAALVAIIASVDWAIKPNFSLNFLYLFPIMLAGGFLSRWQIVVMGVCCAILGELFSPFLAGRRRHAHGHDERGFHRHRPVRLRTGAQAAIGGGALAGADRTESATARTPNSRSRF